jgi:hypothetical protein
MTKKLKADILSGCTLKLADFLKSAKPSEVLGLFTYEADNAARPNILKRLAGRYNALNRRAMLASPHRGVAKAKKARADGR